MKPFRPLFYLLLAGLSLLFVSGCETVLPGPDLHWVLLSKEKESAVKAQVILPAGTKTVEVPVVGDVERNWSLRKHRMQVSGAMAELISTGKTVLLLRDNDGIQEESFVEN